MCNAKTLSERSLDHSLYETSEFLIDPTNLRGGCKAVVIPVGTLN